MKKAELEELVKQLKSEINKLRSQSEVLTQGKRFTIYTDLKNRTKYLNLFVDNQGQIVLECSNGIALYPRASNCIGIEIKER